MSLFVLLLQFYALERGGPPVCLKPFARGLLILAPVKMGDFARGRVANSSKYVWVVGGAGSIQLCGHSNFVLAIRLKLGCDN